MTLSKGMDLKHNSTRELEVRMSDFDKFLRGGVPASGLYGHAITEPVKNTSTTFSQQNFEEAMEKVKELTEKFKEVITDFVFTHAQWERVEDEVKNRGDLLICVDSIPPCEPNLYGTPIHLVDNGWDAMRLAQELVSEGRNVLYVDIQGNLKKGIGRK